MNRHLRNKRTEPSHKIITFPEIQKYQEIEGFMENSELINSEEGYGMYGRSAYLVSVDWLNSIESIKGSDK